MNQLVGERLSIITSKAQTTRHRIMGIISGEDFQVVYSDTPGIIKPQYSLHQSMMHFVQSSLNDADVILLVTDLFDKGLGDQKMLEKLNRGKVPILLLLNKIDLDKETKVEERLDFWKDQVKAAQYIPISALKNTNVKQVFSEILKRLPEHPAYFPKDNLTDKPERFFASEIIREKIFTNYSQEIPYSSEVNVTDFQEDETIIRMRAEIYVERQSQKGILIGKKGAALKKVGIEARKDLETFFQKQVYLETFVKVVKDWRKKSQQLKRFGYQG